MANRTLMSQSSPAPAGESSEASPFLVEFFMVQGPNFRCMAYYGHDGKWRGAFNHQELTGEIWLF